ncbi:MAG: siderophore-interacting protein [Candidatus Dormiibacterota bacterium]
MAPTLAVVGRMTSGAPLGEASPGPSPASATPSPLPPPHTMSLEVAEVHDLGPSLREIRLKGAGLRGFQHAPGQDLMLRLPLDSSSMVNRRYSIRRADGSAGHVDLNVVLHGDGPAARWAGAARPGQQLPEVVGPRGKITWDPAAAWHLFLGDETYISAVFAMLGALPAEALALAVLEVTGPDDELPCDSRADAQVRWLHRGGRSPGDPEKLLEVLEAWSIPPGSGHIYIAAEVRVALSLRDHLVARGFSREQISAKGYWSRGRANASRGEPDEPE